MKESTVEPEFRVFRQSYEGSLRALGPEYLLEYLLQHPLVHKQTPAGAENKPAPHFPPGV